MKRPVSMLAALLLSACALTPGPNTPSGNLEITVYNVRPDCAQAVLARAIESQGYAIESQTSYRIIARRSGPENHGTERISVQFLDQPETAALQIIIYPAQVSHPGTAFESLNATHPTQQQQEQFLSVKQDIQSSCAGLADRTRRGR